MKPSCLLISLVIMISLGACASDEPSSTTPERFAPIGVTSTPERPFLPVGLPRSWKVVPDRFVDDRYESAGQAIFMPPRSTVESGPALLVGVVHSDSDEWAPQWCDPPSDPGGAPAISRWGHAVSALPVNGVFDDDASGAYVLGRGIADVDLQRAAESVVWPSNPAPPTLSLPPGFEKRATGDLPAHGVPLLARADISGNGQTFTLGQQDNNAAGVFVAKFWKSVTRGQSCPGYEPLADRPSSGETR